MQARKTLLFREGIPWVKKERNEDFDVLMSCFDCAEICRKGIIAKISVLHARLGSKNTSELIHLYNFFSKYLSKV